MVDHGSSHSPCGTVEIESTAVPYIDVRSEHPDAALGEIDRFVHEIEQVGNAGVPSIRGLVIAAPQPSDGLALSLAQRGIMLIVGSPLNPLPALLDRFKRQLNLIRAADRQGHVAPGRSGIAASASGSSSAQMTRHRTESPYAHRPPGFNQAVFDERLRELQQPWCDEDAWKSDT